MAEADGRAVAALCGYNPIEAGIPALAKAIDEAAERIGWSDAEGAWIIENVTTLPSDRRRGLVNGLLKNILEADGVAPVLFVVR